MVIKVEEVMDSENAAANNIDSETVEAVDLTFLSRKIEGLIKRVTDFQERITQDSLRTKGSINLNRDCFVLMGVCLFFKPLF